jgi:hypothetical protein
MISVTASFGNGYAISNIDLNPTDDDGKHHPCGTVRSDGINTWVFNGGDWQHQPQPYIAAWSDELNKLVEERRNEELMLEKILQI